MNIEITDLRFRSLGDNILMYNFTHNTNKDLAATMPELTTQTLGIDVSLVRILRNGVRLKKSNHQVSITAKLTDRIKKDKILNAQKINETANYSFHFISLPSSPHPLYPKKQTN